MSSIATVHADDCWSEFANWIQRSQSQVRERERERERERDDFCDLHWVVWCKKKYDILASASDTIYHEAKLWLKIRQVACFRSPSSPPSFLFLPDVSGIILYFSLLAMAHLVLPLFLSFSPFPFFSWNFWSLLLTHNFLSHRRMRRERERERERDETRQRLIFFFFVQSNWKVR